MNAMTQTLKVKFAILGPLFDEPTRRLWAAAEARSIGRGGVTRVAEATGMSRSTVRAGLKELDLGGLTPQESTRSGRLRSRGGGQGVDRARPGSGECLGASTRPGHTGRPDGAVALDVQQRGAFGAAAAG